MRFILGWTLKLAFAGFIYAGVTGAIPMHLPDTILGYELPASAKRFVGSGGQIQDIAGRTQAGFKSVADSLR